MRWWVGEKKNGVPVRAVFGWFDVDGSNDEGAPRPATNTEKQWRAVREWKATMKKECVRVEGTPSFLSIQTPALGARFSPSSQCRRWHTPQVQVLRDGPSGEA